MPGGFAEFSRHAEAGEEPGPGLVKPVHDDNPLTARFARLGPLKDRVDTAERWQDELACL